MTPAGGTTEHMDVFAPPAGPFKHTGHKVAVERKNLPANRTNPRCFVVRGIAVRAAEDMAHPFGNIRRCDSPLKNNAFDKLVFFEKAPADRAAFQGSAVRSARLPEEPPFFLFIAPVRGGVLAADKKRTARHQGQYEIREQYGEQKKQGVEE